MEYEKKLETRVWRMTAVMIGLTLLSFRGVTGTWAKYMTGSSSGDSARAAAFVFRVNENTTHVIDLSEIKKPGDMQTVQFEVTNRAGDAVSEVAMKYQIKIDMDGSLPLTCSMEKTDNGTGTGNPLIELSNVSSTGTEETALTGSYQNEQNDFAAAVDKRDTYQLTAAWPEGENSAQYANAAGQGFIRLTVTGEQKD